MKEIIIFVALGLIAARPALAGDDQLKSWYVNLGLGYAGTSYTSNSAIQSFANQQKSDGLTSTPLTVDIGFYWPVGKQLLLGVADTGFSDSYANSNPSSSNTSTADIVASNILFSSQYFLFTEDASWLFTRLDAGLGVVGTSNGSSFFPTSSSSGLSLHAGLGLAIPAGTARIPLMAGYYYDAVPGGPVKAYQIAISVMW